ncbi:hypothetical protein C7N43_05525 [Sphingobacteriales bacterium UPWRP_1]|nr:hypothetical protein C7N43_05525 [Sphingobacteriales bacterium UPWRP_1]
MGVTFSRIRERTETKERIIVGQEEEVKGFCLPALGDGLIIATTSTAGQELMKLRLKSKDFASFPIDNLSAAAHMKQCNFNDFRKQKRPEGQLLPHLFHLS